MPTRTSSSRPAARRVGDLVPSDPATLVASLQVSADTRDEVKDIRIRSVTAQGELGPVKTVGRTAISRVVPQMVLFNRDLYLAWTDMAGDETLLTSVRVPINYAR